ncbi:MAG: hypothetical protein R3A44_14285 [Caldilineaceae bacterium]
MSVIIISGLPIAITDSLMSWARRYGPAEILGTAGALLSALAAAHLGANAVAIAVAGAWGEAAGFYLPMLVREFIAQQYKRRLAQALWCTLRNLLLEFGPAELIDTGLVRPVLIASAIQFSPHFALGILASKLTADIVFYGFAIVGRQFCTKLEEGAG